MKKVLIIRSSKESSWGSCRVISPNLQECYNLLKGPDLDVKYFDIDEMFLKEDAVFGKTAIIDLSNTIKTYRPTEIVFTDHLPHAFEVLGFLTFYIPYNKLPPFVFHIYGDFTFHAKSWSLLESKLRGHPAKFIVASESQHRLVNSFCHNGSVIENFIFPVNGKDYYFSEEERVSTRKAYGVSDDERVILYAGRVTLQKNIDLLITEFAEIYQKAKRPMRLWIVGAFDDMGAHFQGNVGYEGGMFQKIQTLIDSLPDEVRQSITLWGNQPKEQLRKIKNAADMFMSFSLYHDEDYGMSPAEALACGLPSLLTDWGGYSSFVPKNNEWNCKLVPVKITSYGHELKVSRIESFYADNEAGISIEKRKQNAQEFMKKFSVHSSKDVLKDILNKEYQPFEGFTVSLEYYSKIFWMPKITREINKHLTPSNDNFYYDVYKHYISGKEA